MGQILSNFAGKLGNNLRTDFNGKVVGRLLENANISKVRASSTLDNPSLFTTEVFQGWYDKINSLDGNVLSGVVVANTNGQMAQQLFSFNVLDLLEKNLGTEIWQRKTLLADKVAIAKAIISTISVNWYGYGNSPSGNKAYLKPWYSDTSSYGAGINHTLNTVSLLNLSLIQSNISRHIGVDGYVHILAHADASDGVTPSTINTDYIFFEIYLTNSRTAENPNITRTTSGTTFQNPGSGNELLNDPANGWRHYPNIYAQDMGAYIENSTPGTGTYLQHIFSFDIIQIMERQYGTIIWRGETTLAGKIAVAKTIIKKITGNWYGYGWTGATGGYKATLSMWQLHDSTWVYNTFHTASTASKLTIGDIYVSDRIDANGFVHFMASSAVTDGTVTAKLDTDYVEVVIDHVADIPVGTQVSNFLGKVQGSVVEVPHTAKGRITPTLQSPNTGTTEYDYTMYPLINSLNGTVKGTGNSGSGNISQHEFSFDILAMLERQYGYGVWQGKTSVADKVAIAKKVVTNYTCNWYGFGTSPTGNKAYLKKWDSGGSTWENASISHTSGTVAVNSMASSNTTFIQSDGFIHFLASANASDGVTASTVYTDYVELVIETAYDKFTASPSNNFAGKVNASFVENPHKVSYGTSNIIVGPTGSYTEFGSVSYSKLPALDGITVPTTSTIVGGIAKQMFSFNIVEMLERQFGVAIWEGATDKVSKAKAIVSSISYNWYGYGSNQAGNKVNLARWNPTGTPAWETPVSHTNAIVTAMYQSGTSNWVGSDGFFYVIAYAEASDGVIASTVVTDYIQVNLTVKTPQLQCFTQHLRTVYPQYNVGGIYPDAKMGGKNMRIVFYGVPSTKASIEASSQVDLGPYQLQNRWWKPLGNPNQIV